MADHRDRTAAPRLTGYESWLFHRPCPGGVGDVFVSAPISAIGRLGGEPPGRWLIALGDVSGRGEPARRLRAALESELVRLVPTETDPATILKALNDDTTGLAGEDIFATLTVAVIDGERHELSMASAGCPPPLLRRLGGRVEELGGDICGYPLLVLPGQTYKTITVPVGVGDVVVFVSDGATAVIDEEDNLFDDKRLKRTIAQAHGTAASVGQKIVEAIRRFEGDRAQEDDITLLCLGRTA
jgi:sigma-B regulation protein RsbU (phosphoserine phosphatase)